MDNVKTGDRVRLIGTEQKATVLMVFEAQVVVHFDGQPEHLMAALLIELFEKI